MTKTLIPETTALKDIRKDKKLKDGRTYWRLGCGHIRMLDIEKVKKIHEDRYEAYCLQCDDHVVVLEQSSVWEGRGE